jgi:hypothetical protein
MAEIFYISRVIILIFFPAINWIIRTICKWTRSINEFLACNIYGTGVRWRWNKLNKLLIMQYGWKVLKSFLLFFMQDSEFSKERVGGRASLSSTRFQLTFLSYNSVIPNIILNLFSYDPNCEKNKFLDIFEINIFEICINIYYKKHPKR